MGVLEEGGSGWSSTPRGHPANGLASPDQIGLPDFNAGAMENWGLVTYRENSLLFDPLSSSSSNKERVVTVIAHELAHQVDPHLGECGEGNRGSERRRRKSRLCPGLLRREEGAAWQGSRKGSRWC